MVILLYNYQKENIVLNIVCKKSVLHHFSFETPTLERVLSDNADTYSTLEMLKGVK